MVFPDQKPWKGASWLREATANGTVEAGALVAMAHQHDEARETQNFRDWVVSVVTMYCSF